MNPTEWKIVPVDPDEDMIRAAIKAFNAVPVDDIHNTKAIAAECRAMINAAPPSPFVMVAREDLEVMRQWKSIAMPAYWSTKDGEVHDRLTQALETQPQAEG